MTLFGLISAIWGEHPGVYVIVYKHDVHLKILIIPDT